MLEAHNVANRLRCLEAMAIAAEPGSEFFKIKFLPSSHSTVHAKRDITVT